MDEATRNRSLQDLENKDWGDPETGKTSLKSTCLKLRRVPLNQLSFCDLRLLIGQKMSLSILVPIAIEHLETDPFIEAGFFIGDLLFVVLEIEKPFWENHSEELQRVQQIVFKVELTMQQLNKIDLVPFRKRFEATPGFMKA